MGCNLVRLPQQQLMHGHREKTQLGTSSTVYFSNYFKSTRLMSVRLIVHLSGSVTWVGSLTVSASLPTWWLDNSPPLLSKLSFLQRFLNFRVAALKNQLLKRKRTLISNSTCKASCRKYPNRDASWHSSVAIETSIIKCLKEPIRW